jgi:adenylylsulfate kinase
MSTNIVWHNSKVSRFNRENLNNHKGAVLWFTGLSGSGKSTLAHAVEEQLYQQGCRTYVLDGDNVRHGLSSNLSFSEEDRKENIRRIGEVAKLMMDAGIIVMTAFISPFIKDRADVRKLMPHGDFIEIYCNASLETCEKRDVKGLYKKARAGEIKNYTGIDSPYEAPEKPDLSVNTGNASLEESVNQVLSFLANRQYISKVNSDDLQDMPSRLRAV